MWSISPRKTSKIGATMWMSDFKAKMYLILFPVRSAVTPDCRNRTARYTRVPDRLA